MLFICYPKCGTCQKAKKWLDENGIAYEMRDIKTDNPTAEELRSWTAAGVPVKKLWNTSGMGYRALNMKERLLGMTEEEQIELLSSDGMLVKRPILVGTDFVLTGFKQAEWEKAAQKQY